MPTSVRRGDVPCWAPARLHVPTDGTVYVCPLRITLAEPADAVPASVAWAACAGAVTSTPNTTTTATIASVLMPRMIGPPLGPVARVDRKGVRDHSSGGLNWYTIR